MQYEYPFPKSELWFTGVLENVIDPITSLEQSMQHGVKITPSSAPFRNAAYCDGPAW
jgi:hypothetical protein